MARIARFILISAPIERVFGFVADFQNLPRIQAQFSSVRLLSTQQAGLGAQVEAQGRFRGLPITTRMTIVEFTPPHLLVSDSSGGVRSRSIWRFRDLPSETGDPAQVRASLTIDYEVGVPGLAFLGNLVQHDVESMTVESLQRLKLLVEGGAA
ncbi:MAG TPA: SRPBCC family protein [Chloroflexia bacterium]|nr:SRPBCC family protein [Chloroflexia bacterium]